MTSARPISILVAALGGEGGGVLTQWLVEAAAHAGHAVQSTSIPGVAQRTGSTTYYVEIHPMPIAELRGRRPVFALAPTAGAVDLFVASERLEAVRAAHAGYVDPERTTVIASTSRTLTAHEKVAMGDGRVDDDVLRSVLDAHAARHVAFDMQAEAHAARTAVSAVLFGAIAGSGLLPFDRSHAEAAIEASGKGVAASLAGFARGFDRVRGAAPVASAPADGLDADDAIELGAARLVDYQDARYASLYRERVARIAALEARLDPSRERNRALTRETARFLALWMAFDDVVRVADLKTRRERYARLRADAGARPGDVVTVHDYLKPRVHEIAGALPPAWSRRLLGWDARRRARGAGELAFPLALRSDSRVGHALLKVLASTKRFRPASQRYASEQAAIERWLAAIERAATIGWGPAHAFALCGRLVKGYGDTHRRAHENLGRILDTLASDDAFARFASLPDAYAAAIDSAREAALADPDGKVLDRDIARHGAAPRPIVAKPLVFVRPQTRRAGQEQAHRSTQEETTT